MLTPENTVAWLSRADSIIGLVATSNLATAAGAGKRADLALVLVQGRGNRELERRTDPKVTSPRMSSSPSVPLKLPTVLFPATGKGI